MELRSTVPGHKHPALQLLPRGVYVAPILTLEGKHLAFAVDSRHRQVARREYNPGDWEAALDWLWRELARHENERPPTLKLLA